MDPRRGPDDAGDPMVIELADGDPGSGDDVSFGGPSRPGRRLLLIVGGLVGVIGLIAIAGTLGADQQAAAPATTAVEPTTTVAEVASTRSSGVPLTTVAPSTTAAAAYVPLAPFTAGPGWDVYLLSGSGYLASFDLTAGTFAQVPVATPPTAVRSTAIGPVIEQGAYYVDQAVAADGSTWSLADGVRDPAGDRWHRTGAPRGPVGGARSRRDRDDR